MRHPSVRGYWHKPPPSATPLLDTLVDIFTAWQRSNNMQVPTSIKMSPKQRRAISDEYNAISTTPFRDVVLGIPILTELNLADGEYEFVLPRQTEASTPSKP